MVNEVAIDPLWANVVGYMGPIRNYNPDNWTYLKQEDILEIVIEVTVGNRVYFERQVLEYDDVNDYELDVFDIVLSRMVAGIDKRLQKRREKG